MAVESQIGNVNRTGCGELLLVDDDVVFARVLARALGARGFRVHTAASIGDATARITSGEGFYPDFAILDLNLDGSSGLKLIGAVRRAHPHCRIVILTGYASVSTAVDAIKLGADQYLAKPIEVDAIVRSLVDAHGPDDGNPGDGTLSVSRLEWEHIQRVLGDNDGNISATSRALKMHRRTLQRKLSKRPVRE
jgi:two-component system response regulator RegA